MTTKQFDPNWPFPQFNEDGVQLFAPGYDEPAPKVALYEEFGEAPF
jgi:hypothetical protein